MKKMLKSTVVVGILLIVSLAGGFFADISAGVELSGSQSGVWDAAGSPYYITGDVTVPAGQKLEIDASSGPVYVIFNGTYSIFVDGDLYVNGTAANSVYFMSNQSVQAYSQWGSIVVSATGHIEMNNSVISGAQYGVDLQGDGNIIRYTEAYNCTTGIRITGGNHTQVYAVHSHDNYYYGIHLTSSAQNNTIEECNASYNRLVGIYDEYGSDNTTILDSVAHYNRQGGPEAGIYIYQSSYATIINCTANHNGGGIALTQSERNLVENCTAIDNDYNTYSRNLGLSEVSNSTIRNSVFKSEVLPGETAIWLSICVDNVIDNNTLVWGQYGVHLQSNDFRNIISNNTMYRNNFGVLSELGSNNNTIINNTIDDTQYVGIQLGGSADDCVIKFNTINNTWRSSGGYGIYISDSSRNLLLGNTVQNTGDYGICIAGSSENNTIYHNNFFNNTHHAYDDTDSNFWNASYPTGGNYWDNYTGMDEYSGPAQSTPGSDLIGDTPYTWIDGGTLNDSYPLVEPFGGVPPESSVNSTDPYWHVSDLVMGANATDIGSGVASVTLFYRVSYDNSTWGGWTSFGPNETGGWTWTFTFPGGDGYYEFYSVATDKAGYAEDAPDSADTRCGYDSTPPSVEITSPASGSLLSGPDVAVNWQGSDDMSGLDYYLVRIDAGTWIAVGTDTAYTFSATSDGTHTVDVRAADNAGMLNITSVSFTVDSTAPGVAITSPSGGEYLNSSGVTVSWTGSDATSGMDRYEFRMDGGGWIDVGTATSRSLTDLSEGSHTADVKAVDNAGNEATDSVSFTVDTVNPMLSITQPADGALFDRGSVTLSWTGSDATSGIDRYEARLDNGSWLDMGQETAYDLTGLSEGQHTAYVRALDGAGNVVSDSVSFTVDAVNPMLSITEPVGGEILNTDSVTVSWTASDAGSGIDRYDVRIDGGSWIDVGTATAHDFAGLSDGEHTVDVKAVDNAGNEVSATVTFDVDTLSPEVSEHSPVGTGVPVDSVISVEFSEPMNQSSVKISVTGIEGEIVWLHNTASFVPSTNLSYGTEYTVNVTGSDRAGNPMEDYTWSFTTTDMGTLTGRVLGPDGSPVSGATVVLDTGERATTDESGFFSLKAHAGAHVLSVSKTGYVNGTVDVSLEPGGTTQVPDIELEEVSDEAGGFPIAYILLAVVLIIVLALVVLKRMRTQDEKPEPEEHGQEEGASEADEEGA